MLSKAAFDQMKTKKITGVLGCDFLKSHDFYIDYPGRKIYLSEARPPEGYEDIASVECVGKDDKTVSLIFGGRNSTEDYRKLPVLSSHGRPCLPVTAQGSGYLSIAVLDTCASLVVLPMTAMPPGTDTSEVAAFWTIDSDHRGVRCEATVSVPEQSGSGWAATELREKRVTCVYATDAVPAIACRLLCDRVFFSYGKELVYVAGW